MGVNRHLLRDVTLLVSLLCQHLTFSLDLTVYETNSYSNPVETSEFTHFVTHNVTGSVYIGASDALFQLREDWTKQVKVNTRVEECEEDVIECPNYNKILLIDYEYNRLITCGSETVGNNDRGTCETRDLSDIMTVLHESEYPVVSSGMLTTEAIVAPGPYDSGGNTLYVAATYEEARHYTVPLVGRRFLRNNNLFQLENTHRLILSYDFRRFSTFLIRYIYAYTWKEFTYFVTHQRKEEENDFISKIQRVCQDSDDFNSFTEITLECRAQSGTVYNLIEAAFVGTAGADLAASLSISTGDDVFYGVFAKTIDATMDSDPETYYAPSMESALCVFKMDDIERMFYEAVTGCFGGGDGGYNRDSYAYQINYLQGAYDGCLGLDLTEAQVIGQICTALNWQYAKSVNSLESIAVIEWSDITPSSIITTTHRQHTVAFIGTTEGDIVKVHIADKDNGRAYERFSVGDHVLRDAEIDKDGEQLTILTKQQLLKLKTSECAEYTTCDECIGGNGGEDGDPYCGWCTLEKRCSLYSSCPMPDVNTRWLPYNSAQCVDISNVSPYDSLPITVTQQQIILTVEQLSDLTDGNSYQCIFDDTPPVVATKAGDELTCTTPAAADIPDIKSDNDHVTMQLYVYSTETDVKFIQRDFYFYECNTHKGCVTCTSSDWACDWCIYSNRCTHNNSKCSVDDPSSIINGENNPDMSVRQGYEQCPQLAAQTEERLVASSVSKSIEVTGVNLPLESKETSYKCIVEIEGSETVTEATRNGNVFTCLPRIYIYKKKVQEVMVSLAVVWNDNRRLDDIFGFNVTLFKCDVDRPDCSRCLSGLTARPELMCGWCKTDRICTVSGSSMCSGGWIPADTMENCPAPVLTGVWPPSGPNKGNTTIAVTGTDLGLQFSDVMMVTVGGQDCSTDGLEGRYVTGNSISCKTLSSGKDVGAIIAVTVLGMDGTPQQSMGQVFFTYRDPFITSFEPMEGFAAGGTIVTITGQYLDACSEISATIGSPCIINRLDDKLNGTTAMCRTTNSSINSAYPLVLSFDGAMRQSQDTFTYRPNPTVSDVQPQKTIKSGGITLTVTGTGFGLAQAPQLVMYIGDEQFKEDCEVQTDIQMMCRTPNVSLTPQSISRNKRSALGTASFGFIVGDVSDLLRWSDDNDVTLEYYEDPVYDSDSLELSGTVLLIMGSNLFEASAKRDVMVFVGTQQAEVVSLDDTTLTCRIPTMNPGSECITGTTTEHPCVVVFHGNLMFDIGTLEYPPNITVTPEPAMPKPPPVVPVSAYVPVIVCVVVLVIILVVAIWYRKKYRQTLDKELELLGRLRIFQHQIQELHGDTTLKFNKPFVLPNNVHINEEDVRIKYSQLVIGKDLGKGEFGEVFAATLHMTDALGTLKVAVKTIRDNSDPSSTIKFLEEGLLMKDCDHLNVLGLVGLTFDPNGNPLIILPLMSNGDLRSFMRKAPKEVQENQSLLLTFALDAAKGMEYLAGKKFVHRDLAARNCMVDENLIVKIADFGLSRDLNESDYYVSGDIKAKLPVKWMAPESLDRKVYNEKTDVWSFGVLMWEVFSHGQRPYKDINNRDMYYHIEQGNRLPCPTGCHEEIYRIMMHCWEQDASQRCNFQEVFIDLATHHFYQVKLAALPSLHGQISANEDTNEGACKEMGQHHNQDMSHQAGRASYLNPIAVAVTDDDVVTIEMDTRNSYPEIIGDAEIGDNEDPTTVADTEMDIKNSYHEIIDDAEIGEGKDVKDNVPLDYVNADVVMKRQKSKGQTVASTE